MLKLGKKQEKLSVDKKTCMKSKRIRVDALKLIKN